MLDLHSRRRRPFGVGLTQVDQQVGVHAAQQLRGGNHAAATRAVHGLMRDDMINGQTLHAPMPGRTRSPGLLVFARERAGRRSRGRRCARSVTARCLASRGFWGGIAPSRSLISRSPVSPTLPPPRSQGPMLLGDRELLCGLRAGRSCASLRSASSFTDSACSCSGVSAASAASSSWPESRLLSFSARAGRRWAGY